MNIDALDLPAFRPGWVWLVGAGPGDPALLTVGALHALQTADVVVHDALVDDRILVLANADSELIYAGKRGGKPSPRQPDISARLVALARQGKCVLRLKGGDPFLFGRGGEEAAFLANRGVAVEVVPGVTSGIAAPAYVGIPVTHRRAGSSVTFVTGHEEIDKGRPAVDWRALAACSDGLVIYMGLHNLARICEELQAGGLVGTTPAAIIQQGSVNGQKHLIATLEDLADAADEQGFSAPAIVVIGEVVEQRIPGCAPMPAPVTMPQPIARSPQNAPA